MQCFLFLSTFAIVLELYVSATLPHTEKWHARRRALLAGKRLYKKTVKLIIFHFPPPDLAAYPNPQWQRQWLQNLALFYRKGNDAIHQHAVFDRWLRRFARHCSCRACCAAGCLVCGGNNAETKMCTIWVRARTRVEDTGTRWFLARARTRARTQHGCCCCTFGASRRSAMRRGLVSLLLFLLVLCVDKLTCLCC